MKFWLYILVGVGTIVYAYAITEIVPSSATIWDFVEIVYGADTEVPGGDAGGK